MHSAHELLTRWPALDVAATRARLQDTFHLRPDRFVRFAPLLGRGRTHRGRALPRALRLERGSGRSRRSPLARLVELSRVDG
jgi:hypothetical protein